MYGPVSLIEVREGLCGGFWDLGLVSIGLVVVEMWGEFPPQSESCAIFEVLETG